MLTAYAKAHGYKDPVFYLDNGYNGSGTLEPANMVLHREVMAGQGGTLTATNAEEGGARFVLTFYKTVL